MKSVVKEWLSGDNISLKQQTLVLSSIRGCDGQSKKDLSRKMTRQLRNVILLYASHEKTDFMDSGMTLEEVKDFVEDKDKYPVHYYMHVCYACEIIGFKHPDKKIREWFNSAYLIIVKSLHLNPETEEECDYRLKDNL